MTSADCGGKGFLDNTAYWGFYYSANDTPYNVTSPSSDDCFQETLPDKYVLERPRPRKTPYISVSIRIMPNWFYYYDSYFEHELEHERV